MGPLTLADFIGLDVCVANLTCCTTASAIRNTGHVRLLRRYSRPVTSAEDGPRRLRVVLEESLESRCAARPRQRCGPRRTRSRSRCPIRNATRRGCGRGTRCRSVGDWSTARARRPSARRSSASRPPSSAFFKSSTLRASIGLPATSSHPRPSTTTAPGRACSRSRSPPERMLASRDALNDTILPIQATRSTATRITAHAHAARARGGSCAADCRTNADDRRDQRARRDRHEWQHREHPPGEL